MYQDIYFWNNKFNYHNIDVYYADIDTTFALCNKKYFNNSIRVASNFTAKHLPWYYDSKFINIYDNNEKISTIKTLTFAYIDKNYEKINTQVGN